MKFTLSEWASIQQALGTALCEAETLVAELEIEVKTNPDVLKDYLEGKMKVAEWEGFISRIESATV